jgi:7,8-dihydropterin-6-yl-methyl-4-(beta-D-ribofuranosyl)aminobenzene 5'-phosphate synthase
MTIEIKVCDQVEILTLQDNYVDLVSWDDTEMVKRARIKPHMGSGSSLVAEHGFSALVNITYEGESLSFLFDFGFSKDGAARNAKTIETDLTKVEVMVLSHGHLDHTGGIAQLAALTDQTGIEMVTHPAAFTTPRYRKTSSGTRIDYPAFTRAQVMGAGCTLVETTEPYPLLDGLAVFLGEIPRQTEFEQGDKGRFFEENGEEKVDRVDEDTAVAIHLKNKGLIILSGCAHSGIVNTIMHAQKVTDINRIHAVMGGLHLPTPTFDNVVTPTIETLKELDPDFIVPTHCTGRKAILQIERALPGKFIMNMTGTRIIFDT